DADQRTYRADFSKFASTFPDFEFEWTPERGAADLADRFRAIGLTDELARDARFTRLRWLRHLLDSGHLDDHLRWTATAGVQEGSTACASFRSSRSATSAGKSRH